MYWLTLEYPVKGKIEGTHFFPLFDEETRKAHPSLNNRNISVPIYFLPNKTMIPKVTGLLENHGWSCTTTSLGDGGGWHIHATSEIDEYRIFDIIPSKKHPGILEVRNFQARDKWSELSDDGRYKCVNEYSTDFYGFLGGLTPSSGEKEVDIILEKTIYNDEVANPTYTHKRTREGDNVTTTTTIPAGGSKIRLIFQ